MYLMYVDESGDIGPINVSPTRYFILSAIVVHEMRWRNILQDLVQFRQTLKVTKGLKINEEIHCTNFISRPGPLVRIPRNDRLDIIKKCIDWLDSQTDISIYSVVVDKNGKPLEYDKDASGNVVQGKFGQQVRHPFSGVALAYKHGIPGEVLHIIATHSHEGDKVERSIESIIFHHADFVDFDIAKFLGKRAAN